MINLLFGLGVLYVAAVMYIDRHHPSLMKRFLKRINNGSLSDKIVFTIVVIGVGLSLIKTGIMVVFVVLFVAGTARQAQYQ